MSAAETLAVALSLLACGLSAAAFVASNKRHARLKRRLDTTRRKAERLRGEILPLLRPLWSAHARASATPRLDPTPRGEHGEDMLLFALFEAAGTTPENAYYIEAGGFDGRTNSSTWILDAVGWPGMLVEPVPRFADKAEAARPDATVVRAALGPPGTRDDVEMLLYPPDDANRDLWAHVEGTKVGTWRPDADRAERITVPRRALRDLIEQHAPAVTRPDLVVLDVEGAELDALAGLDPEKHPPRVLVIEDHGDSPDLAKAVARLGYTQIARLDFNRVYVHRDEAELLAAARDRLALDQNQEQGSDGETLR